MAVDGAKLKEADVPGSTSGVVVLTDLRLLHVDRWGEDYRTFNLDTLSQVAYADGKVSLTSGSSTPPGAAPAAGQRWTIEGTTTRNAMGNLAASLIAQLPRADEQYEGVIPTSLRPAAPPPRVEASQGTVPSDEQTKGVPIRGLTHCPDCGESVSRRAYACIHCGAPLTSASSEAQWRQAMLANSDRQTRYLFTFWWVLLVFLLANLVVAIVIVANV